MTPTIIRFTAELKHLKDRDLWKIVAYTNDGEIHRHTQRGKVLCTKTITEFIEQKYKEAKANE